jgi:hypothetical protein
MSVANSGVMEVIGVMQEVIAKVGTSTGVVYNWRYKGRSEADIEIPAGPLPAGVYAVTGFVMIEDKSFTEIVVSLRDSHGAPVSDLTLCGFAQPNNAAYLVTVPVTFYFDVTADIDVSLRIVIVDPDAGGEISASVQLYAVNQSFGTIVPPP